MIVSKVVSYHWNGYIIIYILNLMYFSFLKLVVENILMLEVLHWVPQSDK